MMRRYSLEELFEIFNFNIKEVDGNITYFIPNFGWNTKKQLEEKRENIEYIFSIDIWTANPNNCYNCEECPYNNDSRGNLPCGQQHCWVSCTCKDEDEEDY